MGSPGAATVPPRIRASSWLWFIALVAGAVAALNAVGSVFSGDRTGAVVGRAMGYLAVAAILIVGSVRLLKRDHLPADLLGLSPSGSHARALWLGCLAACLLMAVLIAVMYAVAPFRWQPGSRSASSVAWASLSYFCGNGVEELLFRGYALIALSRLMGTTRALWLLALPFGLFHAPGLSTAELIQMILTTGAMHFVFAYAYLGTRSLWAAISLHAIANVLLHTISGFGRGESAFEVVVEQPLPTHVDIPFMVFFGTAAILAVALSRLPAVRRGSSWLEGQARDR